MVLPQQIHIHARTVIKTLGKAERNHIAEVSIANFVFTEQNQMIWLLINAMNLIKVCSARNIDLAADNGLDPGFFCCAVKINRAIHDAMVGQGNGVLTEFLHPVHHRADATGSVKQAVFAVNMQTHKGHGVFSSQLSSASATSLRMRWFIADLETGGVCMEASSCNVASGFSSRSFAVSRSFSGRSLSWPRF